jgi:activator of HSP90 ATPase
VQAWRTTEFGATDPDSQIDIKLEATPRGTHLTLHHTNIPAGQPEYRSDWVGCYFSPLKDYFGPPGRRATRPPARRV